MESNFNKEDPLTKWRKCLICGTNYTIAGKSFLGTHQCREHASPYIIKIGVKKFVWPCCGVESSDANVAEFYKGRYHMNYRGCVPCDHKDDKYDPYCTRPKIDHKQTGLEYKHGDNDVVVPVEAINREMIAPLPANVSTLTTYRSVICLYDAKEAERINKNRPVIKKD